MTAAPSRILIVTGLSGAGKSTALRTLEDLGWEVVDNLPLPLLDRLLSTPAAAGAPEGDRPLAVGVDSRTRGFDAPRIVRQLKSCATDMASTSAPCSSTAPAASWSAAIPRRAAAIRWRRTVRPRTASPRNASCSPRCGAGRTISSTPPTPRSTACSRRSALASAPAGATRRRCRSCPSAFPAGCRATPISSSTCASCATRTGIRCCAR